MGLVAILTGVLWFCFHMLFILSGCLCAERIIANVGGGGKVCVCLVTLGVSAATSVGIKWHHVGKNT